MPTTQTPRASSRRAVLNVAEMLTLGGFLHPGAHLEEAPSLSIQEIHHPLLNRVMHPYDPIRQLLAEGEQLVPPPIELERSFDGRLPPRAIPPSAFLALLYGVLSESGNHSVLLPKDGKGTLVAIDDPDRRLGDRSHLCLVMLQPGSRPAWFIQGVGRDSPWIRQSKYGRLV